MTIYKQKTIPYDDGTERVIYSFPSLKDCNDLKKFLVLLESICGKIDEMIISNCTSDDEAFYKRYDDLPDFLDNFNLQNIREYNTYTFTGCNKNDKFKTYNKIDTVKNTFSFYKCYDDEFDEPQKGNYRYYKFKNGTIVRINMTGRGCHYLTKDNRWKLDYSYEDWIYDAAYSMVEISDPLSGKADEYERQYEEILSKRMEHYKQFGDKIIIVDPDDAPLSSKA